MAVVHGEAASNGDTRRDAKIRAIGVWGGNIAVRCSFMF